MKSNQPTSHIWNHIITSKKKTFKQSNKGWHIEKPNNQSIPQKYISIHIYILII